MRTLRTSALFVSLLLFSAACGPDLQPYSECSDDGVAGDDALVPMAPELLVPNVDIGVAWYRDTAGFTLVHNAAAEHSCFAVLAIEGDGQVLLAHRDAPFDPPDDSIELRFVVSDVDAVNDRLKDHGATYVREIDDTEYGLRDFVVRDLYGFRVRFATPL